MIRFLILLSFAIQLYSFEITNYHLIKGCILDNNGSINVAIREFSYKDKNYYLVVNPNTLTTRLTLASKLYNCPKTLNSTKYFKLLSLSVSNTTHPLQNDGITSAKNGIYLTTDLCPSSKRGFEDRVYKAIIKEFKNPVPLTLFITKKWINRHKLEFNQLKLWQKEGKLDINWGNHTANHIYHKNLPLNKNFVLAKEEHLTKDILDLEKTIIENGLTPSIFFRFPGLVSNKKAIFTVKKLGLITVGSNTWLAKGEKLKNGSIILIHGNKNEPKGVDIFLKLLKNGKIKELSDLKEIELE